jgi:hypothetical protein
MPDAVASNPPEASFDTSLLHGMLSFLPRIPPSASYDGSSSRGPQRHSRAGRSTLYGQFPLYQSGLQQKLITSRPMTRFRAALPRDAGHRAAVRVGRRGPDAVQRGGRRRPRRPVPALRAGRPISDCNPSEGFRKIEPIADGYVDSSFFDTPSVG